MSDESLSQNQVESLLKAMEIGRRGAAQTGSHPNSRASEVRRRVPSGPSPIMALSSRVTAYDFKRPERVGKDQMRAMHSLHEALARNFGASMSGMLRTMIEVKLLSVDQLTYSEFVFSLDNPSCFNVLNPDPLDGNWILDIAPSLSYAIIDRMLGGDPNPNELIRRPLTEIENRLIGRVVQIFLTQLKNAWENIVELEPSVESVESNPQLVQIVPPNEVVILVGFEVLLGKNRGMLNLCIPFNTIENFNSKLSRNGWVGYGKGTPTQETRGKITSSVDGAPVNIVVTLGTIQNQDRRSAGSVGRRHHHDRERSERSARAVRPGSAEVPRSCRSLQGQEGGSDRIGDRETATFGNALEENETATSG